MNPALAPTAIPQTAWDVSRGPTAPRPRRGRRLLLALGLSAAALLALLAVTVLMALRVGGDLRTLRRSALTAMPGSWTPQVELSVGLVPALLARAGLSFVDLPPEAQAALRAFRGADVGVYRRSSAAPETAARDALTRVTRDLEQQGWEPAVRVHEGRETVAVFVPRDDRPTDLRAAVMVLDGDQMVLVSARIRPEPLLELALRHPGLAWPSHR